MLAWLALLAACGRAPDCASQPEGMDRDTCLHDQVMALPAAQVEQVLGLVEQIQDPVVRGAAVFSWVAAHAREINPQQGLPLCALLDSRERTSCTRKVSAVHLRR